jgi:uncharacterized protein YkwD
MTRGQPFEDGMPKTSAAPRARPRGAKAKGAGALAWLLVLTIGGVGHAQLPPTLAPLPPHDLEERLLGLTNEERALAGLPALRPSGTLAQAARHHAEEMVRLGYVSHVSPTPAREEVTDRVAMVGGTMVSVGENLAVVAAGGGDAPERAMTGWMRSEEHRRNLLAPRWTHVGFGAREGPDERLYVVQVFASDPNPLLAADAAWGETRSVAIRFEVIGARPGWVAIGRVDAPMVARPVAADDPVTLVLDGVDADAPTHVALGWSADEGSDLIGQESGWYDPTTQTWTVDHRSDAAVARVLSYASSPAALNLGLQLEFETAPQDVVVYADGRPVEGHVTGTRMLVTLPGREGDVRVEIGVGVDERRVAVAHELAVGVRGERVEVRPGASE